MRTLVRSPLNYVGGKFKVIRQLLSLFPANPDTLLDLFCGGLTVPMNVPADRYVANDFQPQVIDLFRWLKATPLDGVLGSIEGLYARYNLSKTNQEGYLALREAYNQAPAADMLFALVTNSFNHQLRWNAQGRFNMPFGRNRSHFNEKMRANLVSLVRFLHAADIEFTCLDFRQYADRLEPTTFVYADPPYRLSTAVYNSGWTEADDKDLTAFLDHANRKGCKFALSCVFTHNSEENSLLKQWSDNYEVNDVEWKYSNASYHKRDRSPGQEVLVTNYRRAGETLSGLTVDRPSFRPAA